MASLQEQIAAAIKSLVVGAGVAVCNIGVSQGGIGEENYPYAEVYIDWGNYEKDTFLVADQEYFAVVRVIGKTQDEAAETAEGILPALLNSAGREALYNAGADNVVPSQRGSQGENIAPATDQYHRDVELSVFVRHVIGS